MNVQEIFLDLRFSRYGTTRVAEQVLRHLNEANRNEVMRALELLTSADWPDAEAPFRTLVLESLNEWLAYCETLPVFDRFCAAMTTLRVLGLRQPDVSELAKKAEKELRSRRVDAFASQLTRKQTPGSKTVPNFIRRGNTEDYEPSLANAKIAIKSLGVRPKYNVFHDRIEFEGYNRPGGEPFSDTALKMRNAVVERFGFDPKQGFIEDATRILALENSFDPVREYLDGLKWDGTPRLDTWLSRYLGADDDELTRAIGRAVMVAGVRRVRRPGCKFDAMLVIEGDQGPGKSTVLKVLAGGDDNFSDALDFRQSYKEHQEMLSGKWIVEAPELSGLSQAAVQSAKQFISKTHDRARKAYARSVEEVPRRCVLIGTTNDATYLKDPTGNRRFWPLRAGKIDLTALRRDRDQLWAEAAAVEPSFADPVTIPEHLWAVAAARQAERVEADPWEDTLSTLLPRFAKVAEGKLRITTQAIFGQILMRDMREVAMRENKRVAACMRRLGWDGPKPLWVGETAVKGYERKAE